MEEIADLDRVSHWSRVTFACTCARHVQVLFENAWPNAALNRNAVDRAITLAEESALDCREHEGLQEARMGACMAAGRAQVPYLVNLQFEPQDLEPSPLDKNSAIVAVYVAKVAEKAAEAVLVGAKKSGRVVWEAYHFALEAALKAGRTDIVEILLADFAATALSFTLPGCERFSALRGQDCLRLASSRMVSTGEREATGVYPSRFPGLRPGLVERALQAQNQVGIFGLKGRFCQPRS